jgi:hypothetical protein
MSYFFPHRRMKTFANDNQATVFELADALKQNYNNTYGKIQEQAIEGIILFALANPDESEATGKQLVDSLFNLMHEYLSDFKYMTVGEFKGIVFNLTRRWIRINKLKESFSKYPDIYEYSFVLCIYSFVNVVRKEEINKKGLRLL